MQVRLLGKPILLSSQLSLASQFALDDVHL
jgi:hypothetical protein